MSFILQKLQDFSIVLNLARLYIVLYVHIYLIAVIIDGIDTSPFSREKLEQFTIKVKEELDREREERNYFQLERDKIRIFWEIALKQLEEAKAIVKNVERASELTQEETDKIIAFERQKIKFMKYEQVINLKALRAENIVALENAKEEHDTLEVDLMDEKRQTKQHLEAKMQAEADELKRTKEKHAEHLVKTKKDYDIQKSEIEDKVLKQYEKIKVELEVRHRTELAEVVQRKNKHLSQLIEQHEKAYAELRNYYNDVTLNNLGLIASIKLKIEEMQEVTKVANKILREALAEAKRLREPLELAILDNKELKRQMANYERDKASLRSKNILLVKLKKEGDLLNWSYENLETQFEKICPERDGIKARFSKAIMEFKEKLSEDIPHLEARLHSLREITPIRIQEVFKMKDAQIDDLRYEAARLRKAHDDLLATYEVKLLNLGVPSDELGFQPLKTVAVAGMAPIVGRGPASLVTKDQ